MSDQTCSHEAMRDDETGELVCIHCGEVKP